MSVMFPDTTRAEKPLTPLLFQVWFDVGCGGSQQEDFWWNSPPKLLQGALDEAAQLRASGWIAMVLPEGQNPRCDGRWDNPA